MKIVQAIGRLLGASNPALDLIPKTPVGLERFEHMMEFARRRNLCGRSRYSGINGWIGNSINLETEQRSFSVKGIAKTRYQSVTWSHMPHHFGIYLVDGTLEFRASHEGIGPREEMLLATGADDLAEIGRCFDHWYKEFDLPGSLGRSTGLPKLFEPTGDAQRDIKTYLEDGSISSFHELFDDEGPVIWVDWGEEDDNIVHMTAEKLALNDLKAQFDNDTCDLLITYRGLQHRIVYPVEGTADRDTSIKALNTILKPDHELRVCSASRGSDTLALMALSAGEWARLEQFHPGRCSACFEIIRDDSAIFGSTN